METIISQILNFRDSVIGFFLPYFGWIKFISLIISGLLLWGIIFYMVKSNFINMKIEQYMDILRIGNLSKRRSLMAWQQIKKKMELGDEANLKLAIIEADKILDELLKISGYMGKNMDERLKQLDTSQLSNISDVWSAHKIRNRISQEPDFHINKQEAELIINIYKKSLQEFGLID